MATWREIGLSSARGKCNSGYVIAAAEWLAVRSFTKYANYHLLTMVSMIVIGNYRKSTMRIMKPKANLKIVKL